MTPENIISEVALVTGIPAPAITGRRRTRTICQARFLAVAAMRTAFPGWTLEATADALRRTHHSISNARIRHLALLKSDPEYKAQTMDIIHNLFTRSTR